MGNIKQINIKNRTYYTFICMINIEVFDSNLLKTGKRSYKNIDIYYIVIVIVIIIFLKISLQQIWI